MCLCLAQNIPNAVTGPASKTPVKTPSYYPDPSGNYVRTFIPQKPITDSSWVNMNALPDTIQITTQYFDYLSRPYETVVKQASPSKKDYVAPAVYDEFSRAAIQYLPYVATTGNYNDGKFKGQPIAADSVFYGSQFSNEDIYYGKETYDGSPLNRVTKQMAPGNSWTGSNKGVSYSWRTNTADDSVRLWTISISTEDDIPVSNSIYANGTLSVQTITDERGKSAVVYADQLGRKILTKVQSSGSPSPDHTGWLCTYYIYDEMNHLRMVIPPRGVSLISGSGLWDLAANSDVIDNLCYYYFYDDRGRVTMKHIPGKEKTYIAYDKLDRPVMTQDENLRLTSQWTFIKYDGQSRPAKTGLITLTTLTKDQVISQAAASTDYPTLSGIYTILTEIYYDDYSWVTGSIPSGTLTTTNINSTNFITTYNASPDYAQQITQSSRIRGSVTGGKTLVLNTSTYLYAVNIYDDHGRIIQTKQTNFTNGTNTTAGVDISTNQYAFSGRLLRNHLQHQKLGANTLNHTLLTKYSYDHVGRLKSIVKNIDNTTDKTIVQNTYNELGQLTSKTYGSNLETQNFIYNIRGWLEGINKTYVETANSTTNYFGEALFYDYGFTTTQLNGNIAGVKWKSTGDDIQRAYGFTYDNINRLTAADFTQQNVGSTSWTSDKIDFSISGLQYDANGNITKMNQRGVKINTPVTIDSLKYTYATNSNQLLKVKDYISDTDPWGDFKDTTGSVDDYVYDVNGNVVKDRNKHIHTSADANGITYNFMDKPDNITVNGKGSIAYVYDASGAVLQKNITDTKTNLKTVVTYAAGFVYQKILPTSGNASTTPDTMQYTFHEEGRIRNAMHVDLQSGAITFQLVYDYFLKDHLGNIRSTITDEQRTDGYVDASLETASLNNEKLYYDNLDAGRTDKTTVAGYPNDTYTNPNYFIQKLNGNGVKIGASMLLKVMAGDKITVRANSWFSNAATPGTPVNPVTDIVSALINSVPGASADKIIQSQISGTVLNPNVNSFLNNRNANNYTSSKPKAFLNVVLLDEQLNPVLTNDGKNTYFQQVDASGTFTTYNVTDRLLTKSGYVYIYVSNETPNIDVFFDNLQVTHTRGALIQDEACYPFGLEMQSISSGAATTIANNYKFNAGTELNDKFDINYYETAFRNYDAQIGRFNGIDAVAENSMAVSPYNFVGNNPISFNDPTGLMKKLPDEEFMQGLYAGYAGVMAREQSSNMDWNAAWASIFANGGGGRRQAVDGGFSFDGNSAINVFAALLEAFNNPDADGNWEFSVGSHNGTIGFWQSYSAPTDNVDENGEATQEVHFAKYSETENSEFNAAENEEGSYIRTKYNYHAEVFWDAETNEAIDAIIDPITAEPMQATYIDAYGRTVTRNLTLFLPINNWMPLGPGNVRIYWSCLVVGRYIRSDGSVDTRMWGKQKSAVIHEP